MSDSLAIFSRGAQMLAEADTIQKAKELKDLSLTAADFARRKGMGKEAIEHCESYVREAELRMGELLLATERAKGNRGTLRGTKTSGGTIMLPPEKTEPTLGELGITKRDSAETQALAGLPDKLREEFRTGKKKKKAVLKQARKAEQVAAVKSAKLPEGKYHVIVADPPWSYQKRKDDAEQRGRTPYPTMEADEIAKMPIGQHAHDDCILWLWTTNAFMREAYEIAAAWGFSVKTILTWAKPKMGCGDWLRGRTEHCLMCVRGSPVVTLTNQTTLLEAPVREHSRKPDEFFVMVESLCPGSKCELFSRTDRVGWATFGGETGTIG